MLKQQNNTHAYTHREREGRQLKKELKQWMRNGGMEEKRSLRRLEAWKKEQ